MKHNVANRERGVMLMAALMMSITILALAASVLTSAVAVNNSKRYAVANDRAMEAAESGIHHLLAALSGPTAADIKAAGELKAALEGTSRRAVRYEITFTVGSDDGHDNDLDGQTDEADEKDVYEIRSTGYADNVQYSIAATIRREVEPVTAQLPGGIAWQNRHLGFVVDDAGPEGGGSFLISGEDVDIDGNPTGLLVPGVAVNGNTGAFVARIKKHRYEGMIVGEGGDWSIMNRKITFDYQKWIDAARSGADVVLDKLGGAIKGGDGPYGSRDHPVLVWAKGDDPGKPHNHITVKNTANLQGYGVLVIDGSLEVQSDQSVFDWKGIVIIQGKLLVDSSWDMPFKIRGGLLMHGPMTGPSKIDKDVNFEIQYSAEAINMAVGAVVVGQEGAWSVFHWREAPINKDGAKP